MPTPFLEEIAWRGLLHQRTADEALDRHLATPGRVAYSGFDPTANSLTIGNLIPIQLLVHWQRAGHAPVALVGGGTGLVGDPTGRDDERPLLSREQVSANVAGQRRIFERLLDFDPGNARAARILDNAEWLASLGFLEVLREVGKHFSVNAMVQKESIRERLQHRDQGISYTEFSYVVLQAYDFLHLHRTLRCTVQLAGSDQYGNITAGTDLIHRTLGREAEAFGITAPLVTRSDGRKMGKSADGAIWLTADRTSPYAFYQYWLNVPDADVGAFLRWFTLIEREELEALDATHRAAPHERRAQRLLAAHMTQRLHGESERVRAEAASEALFGGGDVRRLDPATIEQVAIELPSSSHPAQRLEGDGLSLVELLPETTLARSRREARELLTAGAIAINGQRADVDRRLVFDDLLPGRWALLRRGKREWHATRWLSGS
jgi:tyrosyl-tRNA synthetase